MNNDKKNNHLSIAILVIRSLTSSQTGFLVPNLCFMISNYTECKCGWKWLTMAVYTPLLLNKNCCPMRPRGALQENLISTFVIMYVYSTLWEWLENIRPLTKISYHLQYAFHLYRPHHHQMLAILCLLVLDSNKLDVLAVPAHNARTTGSLLSTQFQNPGVLSITNIPINKKYCLL